MSGETEMGADGSAVDEHDADHGPGRAATMPESALPADPVPQPARTVGPFSAPPPPADPEQAQRESMRQRAALLKVIQQSRPDIAAALATGRPLVPSGRKLDMLEAALIGGMGGAGIAVAGLQSPWSGAGIFGFALLLLLLKLARRT